MRTVGLLLIAAGIGIGALWPWAQLKFLGRELQTLEFNQPRNTPSEAAVINLSRADNPVRVRFRAVYQQDGKLAPVKIPMKVVIRDRDGVFLSGTISFPTSEITADPQKRSSRARKVSKMFEAMNADLETIKRNKTYGDKVIHSQEIFIAKIQLAILEGQRDGAGDWAMAHGPFLRTSGHQTPPTQRVNVGRYIA